MKVEKIDIWVGEIRDKTGGLADALAPIVAAGVDFAFVIATRRPEKPGLGGVYLSGMKGPKQIAAAELAGFVKSEDAHGLRLEAPDRPRLLHEVATEIAAAGINVRSVSASVVEGRCVMIFAFDAAADRDKAARLLAK